MSPIVNDDDMLFRALEEGHPISGDKIRGHVYDPHPTQPFRMPDILWPMVHEAAEKHFAAQQLDPFPWESAEGSRTARPDAWNKWFKPRDGYVQELAPYLERMEQERFGAVPQQMVLLDMGYAGDCIQCAKAAREEALR